MQTAQNKQLHSDFELSKVEILTIYYAQQVHAIVT